MEQSQYTEEQRLYFVNKVSESKNGIDTLLTLADQECERKKEQKFDLLSIRTVEDIMADTKNDKVGPFINALPADEKIIAIVLYYGGRAVKTGEIYLSEENSKQQIEFIDFCLELMERLDLSFGEMPDGNKVNISSKQARRIAEFIKLSLSILDSCIQNLTVFK